MNPWKKIKEELVYDGWRKVLRKRFDTGEGEEDYEIILSKGTVCALVLTSENNVVLARQYRPGPEKIFDELPGGVIDEGEAPEQALSRELLEETGYAGNVELVGTTFHDGYSTRVRHDFVVTDAKRVSDQDKEDESQIEVVEVPMETFREHLRSGKLTDSTTGYRGLEYLNLL